MIENIILVTTYILCSFCEGVLYLFKDSTPEVRRFIKRESKALGIKPPRVVFSTSKKRLKGKYNCFFNLIVVYTNHIHNNTLKETLLHELRHCWQYSTYKELRRFSYIYYMISLLNHYNNKHHPLEGDALAFGRGEDTKQTEERLLMFVKNPKRYLRTML